MNPSENRMEIAVNGRQRRRRLTSWVQESDEKKKDIIGCLPTEVGQMILRLLGPNDLLNCLEVSKRWQMLANCNSVWEPQCLPFAPQSVIRQIRRDENYVSSPVRGFGGPREIPDIEDCVVGRRCAGHFLLEASLYRPPSYLDFERCKMAEEYEKMRARLISRWIEGCFRGCTVNLNADDKVPPPGEDGLSCTWSRDGSIGYVSGWDFHTVLYCPYTHLPRFVPINDKLEFHGADSAAICNSYLALSLGRFVRVMKRGPTNYTFVKYYALVGNTVLLYEGEPKVIGFPCLEIALITEKYIWLYTNTHIYVVTLATNACEVVYSTGVPMKPNIHDYGDGVLVWTDSFVGLFMVGGYNLYKSEIEGEEWIKDAVYHQYIVVFKKGSFGCGKVEAIHPTDGSVEFIYQAAELDVKLHTHGRMVFMLIAGSPFAPRTLMAMDIKDKIVQWRTEIFLNIVLSKVMMRTIRDDLLFCHFPTELSSKVKVFKKDGSECTSYYIPTESFGGKFQSFSETILIFSCKRYVLLYAYIQW